jgi:predicted glycosyltransferase
MVILIDILHPAHVHFFRNIIHKLKKDNHTIIVTARQKEMSVDLLKEYNISHIVISQQKTGLGLIFEMMTRTVQLFFLCLKSRPDLLMGIMGPSIAITGFLLRIPSWIFYDTDNARITNWFAYPLANRVYTPQCYIGKAGRHQIRYPGYHEMAYLHPDYFTPDKSILQQYAIDLETPYTIVRFVSWQASHDINETGLCFNDKIKLISTSEKYGKVYITSESPLPESLQSKHIPVKIMEVHHLIAFAKLVVGESATMASEAAVLGVPALFISDTLRGYTIEEEKKYGLVYNYSRADIPKAIERISSILSDPKSNQKYSTRRIKLLEEKCDVTQYIYTSITSFFKTRA